MNYYALSEFYRPLPELDEWIRRRVRMGYLKQWRRTRRRIRNLLNLGASKSQAIPVGLSSTRTYATQLGMNNAWLKEQGLVSVRDLWIAFHYPYFECNSGFILILPYNIIIPHRPYDR